MSQNHRNVKAAIAAIFAVVIMVLLAYFLSGGALIWGDYP